MNAIKKLYIEETINFAIRNIPQVNRPTLEKFLELVNANGNYGEMSAEQLWGKMQQAMKYLPNACANSLLILADLLDLPQPMVELPKSLPTSTPHGFPLQIAINIPHQSSEVASWR
jgi:hypothetical protein